MDTPSTWSFTEAIDATDQAARSIVVANKIMKPVGIAINPLYPPDTTEASTPFEGYPFDLISLKDVIKNPKVKTKIRPVLISFSGIPKSGKTMAVNHIIDRYVDKNPPLTPVRSHECDIPTAEGIEYHELVATGLKSMRNLCINEVTKESSFAFGVLSAFKHDLVMEGQFPLFNQSQPLSTQGFHNHDLNDHLKFTFQYLCEQESIPKGPTLSADKKEYAKHLNKVLPEGIALINIWDLALNKTVLHFLTALRGHLYNCHSWLFIDLERDLEKLDEPPEIADRQQDGEEERDSAALMKWRPRLHYLLRSCRMSESRTKQRRRVCTIFAKHDGSFNGNLQEKVNILEKKVQPVAKHIGVSTLLEEKIETINLGTSGETDDYSQRLFQKFQHVICETPFEEVPIAWVFLRSLFYRFESKFVPKKKLKEMASECGMDESSLEGFCKFYTSFGSIFDLSLVNPEYQYVIVKPIGFLRSLDSFLYPREKLRERHPTLRFGIVPEEACREVLGGDWPAYIDALVSLNLATRVTSPYIEVPGLDRNNMYYYISSSRTDPLVTEPDPNSVHLITSINTPHVFKQVTFAKHLLASLPQPRLVPCSNMNQTVIKDISTDTTITLVSHSPATRLHLDKPNSLICSHIVKAYDEIAESCDVTTKYKFVMMCVEANIRDAQSLPSSRYHILPDDTLCQKCQEAGRTDSELLKVWNEALRENPIKDKSRPTGELKASELANVAEKIASHKIGIDIIAKTFEISNVDQFKGSSVDDKVVNEILLLWYKALQRNQEPRRLLARKISELGENLPSSSENNQTREEFKGTAKEIDVYYRSL